MSVLEVVHHVVEFLPALTRFAILMALIVVIPRFSRRVRLPEAAGRAFGYAPAAHKTMWSLTLPQVAATLATTLVAYRTFNAAGEPLLDGRTHNAVLVMVLVTAILGPVLTQRFAPRMLEPATPDPSATGSRSA